MDKIVIIGPSGSGKTTLAFNLAAKTGARAIDLDEIYWRENWTRPQDDEFRAAVTKATDTPKWIAADNYPFVRDLTWEKADTLIWLDYSLSRTFTQLAARSLKRIWDRQPICNGNVETLSKTFSTNGVLYWLLKTYNQKRSENIDIFAHPERFPNIRNFIRLRNPAETQAFLDGGAPGLSPSTAPG